MQNDELNAVDERLLDELIAVEEGRVPAAVTPPLRAALSCVDMLRQVWPGHAPVADDAAPDFLGRFRVVRKLGEGGGGIVFLAHDPVLKREIAVKVPRPEALLTPDLRQRFLREARAAAALNHPHVVRVLEAGDIGLVCFIANEYCPGADLKTWLKGWRHPENATVWDLPIPAAVRLVATLADAVDYTHRQGILHRDLKPSNVLLTPLNAGADPCAIASLDELVPRISDFGLAKIADAEASRHGATKTGMVFGTPQYMAPEQAQGRATELGAAVDVYALGVILYELLTGRPPFQADTDVDLLYRVIHDEPPTPSSLRPVIHRDLETICLKCLRKDPTQRYASAGDLARDLRDFLAGVPIQARRLPWWRRAHLWSRRHPARALAALLGVALTGLLGGLTWYQWRLDESETRRRESEKGAGLAVSARDAAEHARRSAEEAANTHKYFATVSRVEELVARRKIGWRSECLRLLKEASALDIESRDPLALRGAACRVLAGVDLVEQGHVPLLFRPHRIAYLPGGKKLAVAQSRSFPLLPCSVLVLDSETGKIERSLRFPPQAILEGGGLVPDGARCLAVSRDGRRLAIGVRSGLIHVWDLHAPGDAPALSWTVANGPVGRVLFAGDNTLLTASDANRLVQSWRLEPAAATEQARVEIRPGRLGIDLNPVQDLLACIASGDRVLFLDPQTLKPARPPLMTRADAFRFHPLDGVAAIARDGRLLLIDWHSGRLVRRLPARELAIAHDGPLEDLLFSSDGTLMISSCSSEEDRRIKIWKVATGECLTVLSAGASGPLPVAWCNASACLAAGVGDDVKTYRLLGQREERCSALLPHPLQALRYR
ncbi:MAG: serine/threonine-protein kinase, partial [Gemmataceae bacterium]